MHCAGVRRALRNGRALLFAFDAYGVSDCTSEIKTNKFVFASFGLYATQY